MLTAVAIFFSDQKEGWSRKSPCRWAQETREGKTRCQRKGEEKGRLAEGESPSTKDFCQETRADEESSPKKWTSES